MRKGKCRNQILRGCCLLYTSYSAVDNIERDEPDDNQEEYESQYTEEDIALLDRQEKEKDLAAEAALSLIHIFLQVFNNQFVCLVNGRCVNRGEIYLCGGYGIMPERV